MKCWGQLGGFSRDVCYQKDQCFLLMSCGGAQTCALSVLSVIDSPGCCLHASWSVPKLADYWAGEVSNLAVLPSWRACTSTVFFLLVSCEPAMSLCTMSLSAWNKELHHISLFTLYYIKSIPSWFLVFNSGFTVKGQAPLWHLVFWSLTCFSESCCVYWHSSLIDRTCFSWCIDVVERIELFSYMWANQHKVFLNSISRHL